MRKNSPLWARKLKELPIMNNHISIALPKGRLAEDTVRLFIDKGICGENVVDFSSRKLIFKDEVNRISFLLIRNADIPAYVEYGAADLGVVGKDILAESGSPLYEFMDFGFGYCRLCSAGVGSGDNSYRQNMKIATKYPRITKEYFAKKGIMVDIIKLYGSIEIAPVAGLSDLIVDLVSTGETMRKNGLEEIETIMESSARLVGNKSLSRAKHIRIKSMLQLLGV